MVKIEIYIQKIIIGKMNFSQNDSENGEQSLELFFVFLIVLLIKFYRKNWIEWSKFKFANKAKLQSAR